ncbi:MAG: DUF456 domain-containing protein [Desulfobacterales bacterium]|nr:DUF456 domain-containing protein [Desulfobacterales bacterium]MDD4073415.1 DUF456 domain-containing protein [Desulfobacterales bacterium]MDD4391579.1 DUF456 domain-containing protein [Desulfobacterales bacterium]
MYVFIIFALLLSVIGLLGCIFPVIPGPLLSFSALCMVYVSNSQELLSIPFISVMGGLMLLVSLLDFVIPVAAAKRYGASRPGLWGSVIGMLLGMFMFPPLGVFIGALAGAVAGELINGKMIKQALGAGWGIFIGNMVSIGLKLAYCTLVLFLCIRALFV